MKPVFVRLPRDKWPARVREQEGMTQCYAVYYARMHGTQRQRAKWAKAHPGNLAGWVSRATKEEWYAWGIGTHTGIIASGFQTRYEVARYLHAPLKERRKLRIIDELIGAVIDMGKSASQNCDGHRRNWRAYLTPQAERALKHAGYDIERETENGTSNKS